MFSGITVSIVFAAISTASPPINPNACPGQKLCGVYFHLSCIPKNYTCCDSTTHDGFYCEAGEHCEDIYPAHTDQLNLGNYVPRCCRDGYFLCNHVIESKNYTNEGFWCCREGQVCGPANSSGHPIGLGCIDPPSESIGDQKVDFDFVSQNDVKSAKKSLLIVTCSLK